MSCYQVPLHKSVRKEIPGTVPVHITMHSVNRNFLRYVLPSVLSFALSGVYTIVDGFFIGNRLGDMGIAAINLGYPVTAFIQAIGTGLGLAGAISYTICHARGDSEGRDRCLGGTMALTLLGSALIMALSLIWLEPVLHLLGAEGEILYPTAQYVRWIVFGTVFQVLGTALVPFIRNMGGASFAMAAMLCGFAANIVFDWLFVWVLPYGMVGAALASVMGQALTMLMAAGYLLRKKAVFRLPRLNALPGFCIGIFKTAIAPFGLVLSPNITLIFMNRFLLLYGDEQALAAYGCIGYVLFIVLLLLQGVGDGCQPLMSLYYGQDEEEKLRYTRRLAYITSFVLSALSIAAAILARAQVGRLFGASAGTSGNIARLLPLFMAALIFDAYTRVSSAYLYATEKSSLSYLLVYAEPVLVLLLLSTLGPWLGLNGVWAANPLARLAAAAIAALIMLSAGDNNPKIPIFAKGSEIL